MAYDIYGNRLERGHCEVHPWVHHDYPCSRCEEEYYEHERGLQHEEARQEHEAFLVWEFWTHHFDDDGRHPMEDVAGGD